MKGSIPGALAALLGLILGFGPAPVMAQEHPADPAEALKQAPWPGMTAWDVAWCRDLVFRAGLVEIRAPGAPPQKVRVKDARGWKKPNGFYGLKLNGTPVDEAAVWLNYAGTMTNLKVLFSYGSLPVDGEAFRD